MAIVQISKIQQRSGNIVDLPQLDDAEFGWATDAKRLFIGKTTPNENIEILTAYSKINFSQLNGAVGNLNISNVSIENGQVLAFDGENWVNKGGYAGGLITLGDVSNVKLTGGAIGYVLETDGTGNLSWTPKSTIVAYVKNIELGNGQPGNYTLVTTTSDSAFGQGAAVTITGVIGTTELNGGTYYVGLQTANSFALYTDANLTTGLDSTGYGQFPYTTVSETSTTSDRITVGDATNFTVGDAVVFSGDLGSSTLDVGRIYYIKDKDVDAPNTWIKVSETDGGNTVDPGTSSGLSAVVYAYGGRLVSSVNSGGGGLSFPGGSNSSIQFNRTSTFGGSADFTFNDTTKQFTVNGNANVGNLNASGVITSKQYTSNVANGTPPLVVSSTTRVANLNVAYANVSDNSAVVEVTTGTYYPVMAGGNAAANYSLGANGNLSFNALTGNLSTRLLNVAGNANVGNLGVSGLISVAGNITSGNIYANSGTIGATSLSGTLTTAAQPNITSVGTLTSLSVTGTTTTGNLSAGNVSFTGSNVSLGQIGNVKITGGTSGFVLVTDGSGNLSFANPVTVGTQPAGLNTQVQYNDGGALGASSLFTFNKSTNILNVSGEVSTSVLTSTATTGTAPLKVNSTTQVANLNAATAGTVTNNAQPNITSLGTLLNLLVSGTATIGTVNATTGSFGSLSGSATGLTNIPGGNVTGKVANAVYADNSGSADNISWTNVSGRPTNVSQFNNDAGYITAAQVGGFAPGTRMIFAQSTAPTGWTKDTTAALNDSALRIVTGSAGTGGSVNFSTAFTNKTVSGTIDTTTAGGTVGSTQVAGQVGDTTTSGTVGSTATSGTVGDTTLTINQIPPHDHSVAQWYVDAVDDGGSAPYAIRTAFANTVTGSAGGGQPHTHSFTGSTHTHSFTSPSHSHAFAGQAHSHGFTGSSIDLAVKYVDVIIATKN